MAATPLPLTLDELRAHLKPRAADCHKGDFGSVGILGGAPGMVGAVLLAARAALRLGAGKVYAAPLDERCGVDTGQPELMIASPERVVALAAPGCLVVGPGLGMSTAARSWLEAAMATPLPLLLDADALNLIAVEPALGTLLGRRAGATLLTPHPGEAARLLGEPGHIAPEARGAALDALVARFCCGVVLKGRHSLIRFPGGAARLNPTGNPGMAAPGMGDVLAGMIAALCAQGLTLEQAAYTGVYLHGAAGDRAVAEGRGPIGLTAGELIDPARSLLNAWTVAA